MPNDNAVTPDKSVAPDNAGAAAPIPTRIVAVTSGKGGVGKTSVTVNLAIALAKQGARVCVLDADTGLANINILLGLVPRHTLEHVFSGERGVADIVIKGPGGVDIIPGASGLVSHVHLDLTAQQSLIAGLTALEQRYDYLLIDTAAGISATVLHFVASAQTALVVITPEPTSLTDAFSLLKVLRQKGYKRPVQVVVNMVADSRHAWRIFERFSNAVDKYIGLPTQWLASISRDDAMRRAVMLQKPVALQLESSPAAESFDKMAEMLDQFFLENQVPSSVFSRYWRRVFERVAERAASRGAAVPSVPEPMQPGAVAQAAATPKPATPPVDATQSAFDETQQDAIATDSGEDAEKLWLGARKQLLSLIEQQRVTNDQLLQLFGELIDASGDAIGHFGVDLAYFLLSRCEPRNLKSEQRQLLDLELFRLGIRQPLKPQSEALDSSSHQTVVDTHRLEPVRSTHQSAMARPAIETFTPSPATSSLPPPDQEQRKHGFDEAGFGSQEELLRRLQEASNGESLTALLASLRHASLVRED